MRFVWHNGDAFKVEVTNFSRCIEHGHTKPGPQQLALTGLLTSLRRLFATQAKGKRKLALKRFNNNSGESFSLRDSIQTLF